jgi:spore coat protein U-like protein
MKKTILKSFGVLAAAALATTTATAAITGQVDVKLKVESGCTVDNSQNNGNMNNFGTLDFGRTSSTWANILTGEVASSGNGGDIAVTCDAGVTGFDVSIDSGERGDRTLSNATDTVAYNVYQDAARSKEYVANQKVAFSSTGTPVNVPIFGSIASNAVAVSEGDYTDTLLVTVSF